MTILYATVTRGTVVLVENDQGSFTPIVKKILRTIPDTNSQKTYLFESHCFHYIVDNGLTFLCITTEGFSQYKTFSFLHDVKGKFLKQFGNQYINAIPYSMQVSFLKTLSQLRTYYSSEQSDDRINKVNQNLDQVKEVMIDNVQRLVERGSNLENMVDKTNDMANSSINFKKASSSLKRAMYLKNIKMWIILGVVLLILAYIIAAIVCKSPIFKGCWKKSTPEPVPAAPQPSPNRELFSSDNISATRILGTMTKFLTQTVLNNES